MTQQQYYVFNKKDARVGLNSNCILWWKPGGHGYTRDLRFAGKFTDADRENGYPSPERCIYVPCIDAEQRAYTEQLVWVDDLPRQYKPTKKEEKEA